MKVEAYLTSTAIPSGPKRKWAWTGASLNRSTVKVGDPMFTPLEKMGQ